MADEQKPAKPHPCPHPEAVGTRWGDPISDERQAELQARLDAWAAETTHGQRSGPFDGDHLSGADVFYLAARALAGSSGELLAARQRLERGDLSTDDFRAVSTVCLNGAILSRQRIEASAAAAAVAQAMEDFGKGVDSAFGGPIRQIKSIWSLVFHGRNRLSEAILPSILSLKRVDETTLPLGEHLEGAILTGAQLEGADLSGAHLQGSTLTGAWLREASLRYAHLERASLWLADARAADLRESHLQGADLSNTELQGTDLRRAELDAQTTLSHAALSDSAPGWFMPIAKRLRLPVFGSVVLGDVHWGGADLTTVDWRSLRLLGDERLRVAGKAPWWSPFARQWNESRSLEKHEDVVRAYRQLAVTLRSQGMVEEADRFLYRA
jgi:uncharacterized protein YjbI with pentapeptide repeats